MGLSNRTLALLAKPFEGGGGPSHSTIDLIWSSADADAYLKPEEEANKLNRVLFGLRALARGVDTGPRKHRADADEEKLKLVVADLATRLGISGLLDSDELESALQRDGFQLQDEALAPVRPHDEPADRLAQHLKDLFGERPELDVARNHYEQASRAFDRGDWEAANAQFRSACDAVYDGLAHSRGCRTSKTGGQARQWLETKGLLEQDEAKLLQAFMGFAGRGGSHAGISDAADCQLRRHFATALMAFGIAALE